MKKVWFGFAAFLFGSSLIYGYDAEFQRETVFDPGDQVVVSSQNDYVSPESSTGLTPRRPQTAPARNVPTTVPVLSVPMPSMPVPSASVPSAPVSSAFVPSVPVPIPMSVHQSELPRLAEAPVATLARRTEVPVVQSAPPVNHAPVSAGFDPHVYAELDRLNSAILQLQRTAAPPDTRRGFSAPRIGGRMFFDSYAISQPDGATTHYQNKLGLRELRLTLTGSGYEAFDYKAELGLAGNGEVNFNDLWIGARNVPLLGYLRVGHYNLETSPAYLTGTSHNALMETTAPATSFYLARRLGVSSEHLFAQDRIRWFVGVFQGGAINNVRAITADNQGYILNTRLTAAPFYANGGRQVLHIGGHYAYVATPLSGISAYLGGSNWLPPTLMTGATRSRQHHRSGIELAYQSGPLAVKSEAFFAQYGAIDANRMARGASVELSYFLTGEHRAYNLATGTFGAATVNRPFRPFKSGHWNLVDGLGAWQFVTQYSYVDLTDWRRGLGTAGDPRYGGYQHDLTFGVNWFWNSNLRWVFAYTRSQQSTGADRRHCYQDIFGVSARVHW